MEGRDSLGQRRNSRIQRASRPSSQNSYDAPRIWPQHDHVIIYASIYLREVGLVLWRLPIHWSRLFISSTTPSTSSLLVDPTPQISTASSSHIANFNPSPPFVLSCEFKSRVCRQVSSQFPPSPSHHASSIYPFRYSFHYISFSCTHNPSGISFCCPYQSLKHTC